MKKFLALAGVAAALAMAAPVAAQADTYSHRHVERTGPHGRHVERDVYRHNDRGHRGPDYRHMRRHEFSHWRPGLARHRYSHFGRPVFYDHYYRVPARDYRGRMVLLTVNAYTGVIISVR
jgi:hypothetical protein